MLASTYKQINDIIDEAQVPILIMVTSEGCENAPSVHQQTVEQKLEKSGHNVIFFSLCIPENEMPFPRITTPCLYYFIPKNHTPVFWRNMTFIMTLEVDLETVVGMSKGLSYNEAKYNAEELQHAVNTDNMLEAEEKTLSTYPSTLQMARNLAKETWKTAKQAANKLPVIVPLEVGKERLETCENCDQYNLKESRCKSCGCYMRLKTQLAASECPLGKWKAYK